MFGVPVVNVCFGRKKVTDKLKSKMENSEVGKTPRGNVNSIFTGQSKVAEREL